MLKIPYFVILYCCFISLNVSAQKMMKKVFIEGDHFYTVSTGIYNKNGILTRAHLDSLKGEGNEVSGYIHVPSYNRFNNSQITFDIFEDTLYAVTASYIINRYSNGFVKVPFSEIDIVDDIEVEKYIKNLDVLSFNANHRLAINRKPIKKHPYSSYPRDSTQTILYDISYADSMNLKLLIYNNFTNKIDHWNFYGEVIRSKEMTPPYGTAKWELTYNYLMPDVLVDNFIAFVMKNRTYLITSDGKIHLAGETLTEIASLPDRLQNGFVIINKEKGEVSFIENEKFNLQKTSLRTLLKNAVTISL